LRHNTFLEKSGGEFFRESAVRSRQLSEKYDSSRPYGFGDWGLTTEDSRLDLMESDSTRLSTLA